MKTMRNTPLPADAIPPLVANQRRSNPLARITAATTRAKVRRRIVSLRRSSSSSRSARDVACEHQGRRGDAHHLARESSAARLLHQPRPHTDKDVLGLLLGEWAEQ